MRSTRATAAVARLNQRCPEMHHSMGMTGGGMFILNVESGGASRRACEAMPLDEFVRFVNGLGPQPVRRMTKSDIAFEKQLVKKPAL